MPQGLNLFYLARSSAQALTTGGGLKLNNPADIYDNI